MLWAPNSLNWKFPNKSTRIRSAWLFFFCFLNWRMQNAVFFKSCSVPCWNALKQRSIFFIHRERKLGQSIALTMSQLLTHDWIHKSYNRKKITASIIKCCTLSHQYQLKEIVEVKCLSKPHHWFEYLNEAMNSASCMLFTNARAQSICEQCEHVHSLI